MNIRKGSVFFITILLLVSIILVSGCTDNGNNGESSRAVKSGDTVQVDYTGMFENGTVFDTSKEEVAKKAGLYVDGRNYTPLTFVVGSGQVIQGFDEGIIGMTVGEEKTLKIPPEKAYGKYDEAKILAIPIKELNITNQSEIPKVGQTLSDVNGNQYKVTVANDTHITVDANNELAGKTLIFDIKLVSIE